MTHIQPAHFYKITIVGFIHFPTVWAARPKFSFDLRMIGYRSRIGILKSMRGEL